MAAAAAGFGEAQWEALALEALAWKVLENTEQSLAHLFGEKWTERR